MKECMAASGNHTDYHSLNRISRTRQHTKTYEIDGYVFRSPRAAHGDVWPSEEAKYLFKFNQESRRSKLEKSTKRRYQDATSALLEH